MEENIRYLEIECQNCGKIIRKKISEEEYLKHHCTFAFSVNGILIKKQNEFGMDICDDCRTVVFYEFKD